MKLWKFTNQVSKMALSIAVLAGMSACATAPVKYDKNNIGVHSAQLIKKQTDLSGFPDGPLSLKDARQLALLNNADYRHQLFKTRLEIERSGVNALDLMPKIYSHAHARWRNNTAASVGIKVNELDADMPEDFYTAQDRSSIASDVTMSWNLLDLGLASFRQAEGKIDSYDAAESTVIGCHQLIADVDRIYWRAVAYQRAEKQRLWLQSRIEYALEKSNEQIASQPEKRLDELMFQRELIDIKRWYDSIFRDLAKAQPELMRLMNAPATARLEVLSPMSNLEPSLLADQPVQSLLQTAFDNRPEIRKTLYARDKIELSNRQDVMRHLPGVNLFVGGNTDSNSFLLNETFLSGGVSLTWDLINLTKIKSTKKNGEDRLALEEARGNAVASAIVGQVLLAKRQVEDLQREMDLAWKAKDIQAKITDRLSRDVANDLNRETFLIKEELLREMSILRENVARAELFAAESRLKQSVGQVELCQTD